MVWVAIALAVIAFGAIFLLPARRVGRLFDPAHLAEMTGQLAGLRDRAAKAGEDPEGPLPHAITTQGLVVCVSSRDAGASHHVSFSFRGRRLPVAAGTRLAGLVLWSLHVDPTAATAWANRDMTIHHLAFALDAEQQAQWRATPRLYTTPGSEAASSEIEACVAAVRERWAGRFDGELPL